MNWVDVNERLPEFSMDGLGCASSDVWVKYNDCGFDVVVKGFYDRDYVFNFNYWKKVGDYSEDCLENVTHWCEGEQ